MAGQPFRSQPTADVVIIGGGVIGLAIARELRRRGVRKVMLIERSRPGAEASSAAAGILAPQVEAEQSDEFFQLACRSRDLYPQFAAGLREQTGVDIGLDMTGTLEVGFTEDDERQFRHRYRWQKSQGLSVEWLIGDEARRLEVKISERVVCALRFPNDFQVENRHLIEALVMANERLGVQLVCNCNVETLVSEQEKVSGVRTSSGFVSAPVVIIAAGAWTSLINAITPSVEIEPVRGQMLCFAAQPQVSRHVIYSSHGYLVPRRHGRLLAGSTSEHVGFDKSVTATAVSAIKSMAIQIAPTLAQAPLIDSWAGFRPRAQDDFPVLGPSEEIEGLFFATGHYRNGILLTPITARLIADAIVDGAIPPSLAAFSPGRFRAVAAGV